MPAWKASRATFVSWCFSLRLRRLRPSDVTVATHLDIRSAHCANMAARSAAFGKLWAGDVMVRVQSGTDTQAADE
eukprot:47245-Prymnesium_polylepis.1